MIRYDVSPTELEALVDKHKPGWRTRAAARTAVLRKKGKYKEASSIWGEIKAVFMEVQGDGKCCFCERKFDGNFAQYELDLEHFRPKGMVRKWQRPKSLAGNGIAPTVPTARNKGYYLLSYHLLNYAAACKPCNSGLKKNYFPISGEYDFGGTDPMRMQAEAPFLLFPLGRLDVDPEDVLSFYGFLPRSRAGDGFLRMRGLVTIVFFGLDDVLGRKNLMRERATAIIVLNHWLMRVADHGDTGAAVQVARMVSPTASHANCARSFKRLFYADRAEACNVVDDVEKFLQSIS